MDPVRHTSKDEALDLRGKIEEIRSALAELLTLAGEEVEIAGSVRVGPRSISYTAEGTNEKLRNGLSDAGGKLRDQAEVFQALLDDERLTAIVEPLAEDHPFRLRIGEARSFLGALNRALEALSVLEETPASELDLGDLHSSLTALGQGASKPLAEPVVASHLTEVEVRL